MSGDRPRTFTFDRETVARLRATVSDDPAAERPLLTAVQITHLAQQPRFDQTVVISGEADPESGPIVQAVLRWLIKRNDKCLRAIVLAAEQAASVALAEKVEHFASDSVARSDPPIDANVLDVAFTDALERHRNRPDRIEVPSSETIDLRFEPAQREEIDRLRRILYDAIDNDDTWLARAQAEFVPCPTCGERPDSKSARAMNCSNPNHLSDPRM